jgi:SpoVK/Ycf46/Vps4 family AAA+-type ATPase
MFSTKDVVDLIKAHKTGDEEIFDRTIQSLAKFSETKGKMGVAKALREIYSKPNESSKRSSLNSLQEITVPNIPTGNKNSTNSTIEEVVLSKRNSIVVEEVTQTWSNREKLKDANIPINNKVMLYGLPGTGKTFLANAIANTLDLPISYVDISRVISSFMGETGRNVDELFSGRKNEVLFLDEFDALAKNRADEMDIGEAKRVVTAILQNLDRVSDDVLIIAATNHIELIDTAIRRRFSYELDMNDIDQDSRKRLLSLYLEDHPKLNHDLADDLAKLTDGFTGHDIQRVYTKAIKRSVLRLDKLTLEQQLLRQIVETKYRKHAFNTKEPKDVKDLTQTIDFLWKKNKKIFTYDLLESITGIPHATIHYLLGKESKA